jgi:hypothetical protein
MAGFAAGLILGVVVGFFLYPLYWSWIAWREHQEASRQARRIEDVLADMTPEAESAGNRRTEDRRISGPRSVRPIGR